MTPLQRSIVDGCINKQSDHKKGGKNDCFFSQSKGGEYKKKSRQEDSELEEKKHRENFFSED
jgi:hypothetical protein